MLSATEERRVAAARSQLQIIYLTFLISTLVLAVLPFSGVLPQRAAINPPAMLPWMLTMVGIADLAFAYVFRKFFFRPKLTGNREKDVATVIGQFQIATLVFFALVEAAGIMGFVCVLVVGAFTPLTYLAVLVLLINWPDVSRAIALVDAPGGSLSSH